MLCCRRRQVVNQPHQDVVDADDRDAIDRLSEPALRWRWWTLDLLSDFELRRRDILDGDCEYKRLRLRRQKELAATSSSSSSSSGR